MNAAEALTPEGFALLQKENLQKKITLYPARAWYLFDAGHPCDRFKAWRWTMWEAQKPHDTTLQSIFDEGHLHQPDCYRRLEALGFKIVRESDRPKQWTLKHGAVISGRVDGRVTAFRGEKYDPTWLLEIKTCSAHVWDALSTADDIKGAREHYIRGYWDQGQLGALLEETDRGVFILKSKATGLLKPIPFALDYGYAENVLKRIERLDKLVKEAGYPEPIDYDPSICGRCGFLHLCFPPKDAGTGVSVIEDASLLEDLEARDKLKESANRFEDLDKSIKSRVKTVVAPGTTAVCGPWSIAINEVPVKEFTVKARVDKRVELKRIE